MSVSEETGGKANQDDPYSRPDLRYSARPSDLGELVSDIIDLGEESKSLLRILRKSIRSSIALSSRRQDWNIHDLGGNVANFGETLEWRNEEIVWDLGLIRSRATEILRGQLANRNEPYLICANALISVAEHINTHASTDWRKSARARDKLDVICELHAQSIIIAEEILSLLRSGHPGGASARWRTLYELNIVASFIASSPKDTALRYKDSHIMEYWRQNELALEEVPKKERDTRTQLLAQKEMISTERNKLLAKYGKEFDGQYGWAAKRLAIRRPTFRDIEHRVRRNGNRILPFGDRLSYKEASQHIHGERVSSIATLVHVPGTNSLYVGASMNPTLIQAATIWTLQKTTWDLASLTTRTQHVAESLYWAYVAYMFTLDADTEGWHRPHTVDTGYLRKRFTLVDATQQPLFGTPNRA